VAKIDKAVPPPEALAKMGDRRMRHVTIALLGAALLNFSPAFAADYFPPKAGAWATHTPAQEKLDAAKLQAAIDYAISAELKYPPNWPRRPTSAICVFQCR
jgi:hypothetical protein